MKKLYEIPRDSKILCKCSDGSKSIIFHRLDGMYSFCTTEKGNVVHLDASTNLVSVGKNFRIAKKQK